MTGESTNVSSVTGGNWTLPAALRVVVSVFNALPNFQFSGTTTVQINDDSITNGNRTVNLSLVVTDPTSGATLVEVGTTNRTHAADYEAALGPRTGAIVSVHRSNFTQEGFVASVEPGALAPIAERAGVPLIHDFGSGLLLDLAGELAGHLEGLAVERRVDAQRMVQPGLEVDAAVGVDRLKRSDLDHLIPSLYASSASNTPAPCSPAAKASISGRRAAPRRRAAAARRRVRQW